MGHVLDLVPNHMGIAKSANPWWQDVLENGPSSRFARVFDIEWHPVKAELANRVLIPILGDQYGEVLERQELTLAYRDGAFAVGYYDDTRPIAPDTYAAIFGAELDVWLTGQHTDAARADADELQSILTAARNLPVRSTCDDGGIAVRARADEQLPRDWPVQGTTGYEFGAIVNNLFVDRRNERALDEIYMRFIRERRERHTFADLAYRNRKQVMHETMSGDINSLGHQLNRFSERNRHFRDFTLYSLISTLKEVIACFPVYRTYVTSDQPVTDHDRRYITDAIRCAKHRTPGFTSVVFDFIGRLLLKQTPVTTAEDADNRARFIGKFQQITSPVAAKGIEDTALYVYNRLVSLNEVGADPRTFGLDPAAVHDWMARRRCTSPAALSSTSTHDTKRGEDVRARINVLSELPSARKSAVTKWRALNRRFKTEVGGRLAPGANEEYLLYQTLVGAWPFDADEEASGRFRQRITAYMTKALREGRVHTSWMSPDEEYEAAVTRFVGLILDWQRPNPFLQSFLPFQARIADLGVYNSLAQVLIKMTAPGVPDFFQGTELWDLALVDPDNRRPVDYEMRARLLAGVKGCPGPAAVCTATDEGRANMRAVAELLEHRHDGRIKLFVITRTLETRAHMRGVYERGDYLPLTTTGPQRDCLFAFARRYEDRVALTCVPRLVATLTPDAAAPPLGRSVWGDTRIELPPELAHGAFRDRFTGTMVRVEQGDGAPAIAAGEIFERLPIALLTSS